MPAKKNKRKPTSTQPKIQGVIHGAGKIIEQKIVTTIEQNYMPYAMSVIMSRAIPEIDGFKPSHRKLLYTMYKMGLLNSPRTKSANIVGQTMKLNPHGDSAIYDTMVRLSRGYEALLHPYVDSKGNFGKFYSRDMAWAASRYTEARLDDICEELFKDIDKNTIDFVDNYDNTLKEPTLLPCTYPSILINANTGIAVGMASSICPFNLKEVCDTTIALIKNENHDVASTLLAPDFPGGGQIIYNEKALSEIYQTGRGGIKIRARYLYDAAANCLDITSIPPTTTSEAIIEKIIDLIKQGKIKDISDIRDETGIDGLRITIDLKRGVNPDQLMQKLYRMTTLEDTFSCNFNVLISGVPKVLSVKGLLNEWIRFRMGCVRRRTQFDLNKKSEKLHLLNGLEKILLNIDEAIRIIKNTAEEKKVVENLMVGFFIDETQAEYVAEIKLRQLNREYLLRRTKEIQELEKDIKALKETLGSDEKIKAVIVSELLEVEKNYAQPRKSMILHNSEIVEEIFEETPDYPVSLFLTKDGYFKKITPQSLRMNSEQKLKSDDEISQTLESSNNHELLFFTDKCQVYKAKVSDFPDSKASLLGEYIPAKLGMNDDESIIYLVSTNNYSGEMMFLFANGKGVRVPLSAYQTKTNRKKLIHAYSDKSPIVCARLTEPNADYLLTSTDERMLLVNASMLPVKSTKDAQGVSIIKLRKAQQLARVKNYDKNDLLNEEKYRAKVIPAPGKR